ncbi:PREDICTED: transmembrane protein 70 homolog, mitochondrial [Drosophila arizonae]|uniref:Transmembrane protein 70 homolog, mitochondrial n=1 Tax=Drosophila arizonae TaxID=7263 RepID=A0ABM1P1L5_DROAR|nr:PREDICTED: transmembrane protein 70 homolog, mitochondrial [Drosophila arizonae]
MLTIRCGKNFALTMRHISRAAQVQSSCGFSAWSRTQLQHQQQQLQQQRKQPKQQQARWLATPVADKDTDDKDLKRIYYGTLAPRMRLVKLFSLSTSLAGLAAQPILMEQGMKIGGTGMAVFLCSVGGFFTFVTPILLHLVTKKYVTELHYNQATDEYIATTISLILLKIKTKFRASDVTVPEVPGMFTSFLVKNRPLFVDPALFDDPEHYVRIMGYDKPIDFKLNLKHESEQIQKKEK